MLIYLAQIGQPLIIRRISDGERLLSEMLEMFNQPPSWWAARYCIFVWLHKCGIFPAVLIVHNYIGLDIKHYFTR